LAAARLFIAHGAKVVLVDLKLDTARDELKAVDVSTALYELVVADVTKEEDAVRYTQVRSTEPRGTRGNGLTIFRNSLSTSCRSMRCISLESWTLRSSTRVSLLRSRPGSTPVWPRLTG
jgi:hypothetical protein